MQITWTKESSRLSGFRSQGIGFLSHFLKRVYLLDSKTRFFFTAVYFYFAELYNALDIGVLATGIIMFILRIVGDQTQWAFASLTFALLTLGFLQYIRVIPSLGAYIASILKIFGKDIPKFGIVILVVLFSFIGSIHLAGRYEAELRQPDNSVCSNSSFIYWFSDEASINYNLKYPFISGLILVLDGGPGNVEDSLNTLNVVFFVVYLAFAFLIIVVLLNILIAQLSETYAEISSEREFHFQLYLAIYFELYSTTNTLFGKRYRPRSVIDRVTLSRAKWKVYLDKTPNRNSDLLVRDIDSRTKNVNDKTEGINSKVNAFKKNFSVLTDLLTRVYGGVVEGRGEFSRGTMRSKSPIRGDVSLESVSSRLDGLEQKMEKIIHLLEAK